MDLALAIVGILARLGEMFLRFDADERERIAALAQLRAAAGERERIDRAREVHGEMVEENDRGVGVRASRWGRV